MFCRYYTELSTAAPRLPHLAYFELTVISGIELLLIVDRQHGATSVTVDVTFLFPIIFLNVSSFHTCAQSALHVSF